MAEPVAEPATPPQATASRSLVASAEVVVAAAAVEPTLLVSRTRTLQSSASERAVCRESQLNEGHVSAAEKSTGTDC